MLQVTAVFREVLGNNGVVLSETTTANEVEEWDSLTHIQLVVAIEKKFRIRFSSREIRGWKNIGELLDTIVTKIK